MFNELSHATKKLNSVIELYPLSQIVNKPARETISTSSLLDVLYSSQDIIRRMKFEIINTLMTADFKIYLIKTESY